MVIKNKYADILSGGSARALRERRICLNFDKYRLVRIKKAPESVEIHFVQNDFDPTGLGEPLFPPVFAAVANALYKATGMRYYDQPFGKELQVLPARM